MLTRYDVELLLGRGGMGAVYKGSQKALDRTVAIKILPAEMNDLDPNYASRFRNEAKAMAKLSHPGIVGVHDFGVADCGLLYFVMEFVEGVDVARMIREQGKLHGDHVKNVTMQVCDALEYAHSVGIVHRDIKPANIMVCYDGRVKVADFGLAKIAHGGDTSMTQGNSVLGTLHYMAPETLTLGTVLDHRSDIYSVGVMLYQMLTGKLPQGMFEMPSTRVPGLDPKFDAIISQALREDRNQRYQSIGEVRDALDEIENSTITVSTRSRLGSRMGRYKIISNAEGRPVLLGSGSCGKTYKALHSMLGTTVALKVIHENLAHDQEVKQRFLNEAKAISALKHPHIAQLVDCDEHDGTLFCAMEFCDGGDLEKLVATRGALSDETVLQLGKQAARALAYVHDQGYLHRDLKPSNLMLSMADGKDEANLKVIDFGLVKTLGQASGLTQRGQFRGTLLYTSPEQLREEELDERADIFGLGMTLWYLLVGGLPLANNSTEISTQRLSGKSHACQLPRTSHPAVRALLTEMLQPEKKRRARNMHIVLSGIDECLTQMKRVIKTHSIKPAAAPIEPVPAPKPQPQKAAAKPPAVPQIAKPEPPSVVQPEASPLTKRYAIPQPKISRPPVPTQQRKEAPSPVPPQTSTVKKADSADDPVMRVIQQPLHSKFELIEEHDDTHGELGMTYHARRLSNGDLMQLTKIQRSVANDSRLVQQLEAIVTQARLCEGHFLLRPNALIRFQDHLVLVEEIVDGLPLLTVLRSRRMLTLLEASRMLRQLAEACDLAMRGGLSGLDLAPHRLIFQFPHMMGARINEKESTHLLSRPTGEWPAFIMRMAPDYTVSYRQGSPELGGAYSASATVVSSMDENTDLPSRFARLTYHVLSGMPIPAAATMARTGYVPIAGIGEEGNRLLARVICGELPLNDSFSLLRTLWQMESLPAAPLSLPPTKDCKHPAQQSALSAKPKRR